MTHSGSGGGGGSIWRDALSFRDYGCLCVLSLCIYNHIIMHIGEITKYLRKYRMISTT